MVLFTTKLLVFLFLLTPSLCSAAAIDGKEDGTRVGYCKSIDFVGSSTTLTSTNLDCTLTSTAGDYVAADGINWADWEGLVPDTNINWDDMVALNETDPIISVLNGIVKSDGTTPAVAVAGTDYLTATQTNQDINWYDYDLVAKSFNTPWGPAYAQELIIGDAPNQFKVDENGEIYDGTFNWTDLEKISEAGVNWSDFDSGYLGNAGINFIDLQELAGEGRGGAIYSRQVTINDASPTTLWDYWQNLWGMVFNVQKITASATSSVAGLPLIVCGGDAGGAVNWGDCQQMEPLDITTKTWEGADGINWYSMEELSSTGINWTSIESLDHVGINWTDMTSPTAVRVSIWGYLTGAGN